MLDGLLLVHVRGNTESVTTPFTFALRVIIDVCNTPSILMIKVRHPSHIGHVSVHHLKHTLLEAKEGLIALICITTVPHFSSVFNLLCPWNRFDSGWPLSGTLISLHTQQWS